jgi:rod shape-determining protein MreC
LHDGDSSLGLVQGQWQQGSRLRLEQVNREQVLVVGATVVSAGLTHESGLTLPLAEVPPGVPIGEVETISNDGYNQVAELRPYTDPDQVYYVWVILNQEN